MLKTEVNALVKKGIQSKIILKIKKIKKLKKKYGFIKIRITF